MKLRLLTILLLLTFGTTDFTEAMKRRRTEQKATHDAHAAARNLKRSPGGSDGSDDDKPAPTSIAATASTAIAICEICLGRLEDDQATRSLACTHCFHTDCITPWFTSHDTCPTCRAIEPSVAAARIAARERERERDRACFLSRAKEIARAEALRRAIMEDRNQALALSIFTEDAQFLARFQAPYKMTALHYAAMIGYVELANVIIAAGADINAQSSPSIMTPLHFAASYGHTECVIALLATPGINPLLQNKDGKTAADVALTAEIQAIIQAKIDAIVEQKAARDARAAARNLKRSRGEGW